MPYRTRAVLTGACIRQPAARESIRNLERQYFAGDKDRLHDRDDRREGRSDGGAGGRMDGRLDRAGGRMAGSLGGRLDLDARPRARYEPYGGGGGMRMDRMEPTDPRDRVLPGPGWRGGGGERWGGRGSGGGGRREPRERREPKSAEDLDKAMENYWQEVYVNRTCSLYIVLGG
jgi:hypothetical protein